MSMRSTREDMLAYAEKTGERLPWPEHGNWGDPQILDHPFAPDPPPDPSSMREIVIQIMCGIACVGIAVVTFEAIGRLPAADATVTALAPASQVKPASGLEQSRSSTGAAMRQPHSNSEGE